MFDPMGLNKEPEAAAGPDAPSGGSAGKKLSHDSPTLWFLLMIVDGLFVVVFGGLVTARLLQHWGAPPPPAAVVKAQPAGKKAKTETAAAEAPEPAKPDVEAKTPPAAAKTPEPAKALAPSKAPEAAKPPKPSLLQPPAKPHEAPKPQGPVAAKPAAKPPAKPAAKPEEAAKPAAPAGKIKAVPVDFRLHAPKAQKVQLGGAFLVHGGKKDMTDSGGDWTVTIYLMPGNYRYNFLVDGRKTLDAENPKIERGASVLTVLPVP